MKKTLMTILFSLFVLPLSAMGKRASLESPAQERDDSKRQLERPGPINDEATAIKIALEYFKKKIDPNGPNELNFREPQVFEDTKYKQWIVSWFFTNGTGRIVIVVNAKTGETYQADTGTD